MEPRIQYARTSDGVSIAFWTLGEGTPFIWLTDLHFGHVGLEWQWADLRGLYERVARTRRLIRYDGRGTGLSDRVVADYSLEARVMDLDAVVERLSLERFAVFGALSSGLVAIAYAARYPARVSHLLLWCSYARASDYFGSPEIQAYLALLDTNWEMFTETYAHARQAWSEGESARRFATYIRDSVTPEALRASIAAVRQFDVTDLLPRIQSPTLVLHGREIRAPGIDLGRGLASGIPDARLLILEGTRQVLDLGDLERVLDAIDDFLGEGEEAAAEAKPTERGAFRTILFTDVEGSTALTQRLGDAKARELLRQHERIVREALKAHAGAEVKTMGDGLMASFSSATKALECAIAMQRAFGQRNKTAEEPIRVRVGLNAGEPIVEEEDLFGTAVIKAARITAMAQGGEILVASVVRELAEGKQFVFGDRGEVALRGFDDPVRLFEVNWQS